MTQEHKPPFPAQPQDLPGSEAAMTPRPDTGEKDYIGSGKLKGKTALITGGDSGIGRAVAIAFAKEGADVAIAYLQEHQDAEETRAKVEREGVRCLMIAGDVGSSRFCEQVVEKAVGAFGKLDILVNNAGVQMSQDSLEKITDEQLERTFRTNIFSMFFLTRAALPHLKEGARIINTASVTAYKGNPMLLDYSSTKGAIVTFTRSLALSLASRGILVNGVAPGPIWTPLIPSTFPSEKVEHFGENVALQRPGQPGEVAPCYVFLASDDSSYMTGQILHPNGGEIVNG